MTLTGLKSTMRDVEELKELLPTPPSPEDESVRRLLASLTIDETIEAGRILSRMDAGLEPTDEEFAFMLELERRPRPVLPPIDYSKTRCHICGEQPVLSEDNDVCDKCYRAAGGYFDLDQFVRDGHARLDARGNILI